MHLTTVHNSRYYSATPAAPTISSTGHCPDLTMTSRIMRGCSSCMNMLNTNTTSFNGNMSATHSFALHSRSIDDKENQGTHAMTIVGVIIGVSIGIILVAVLIGHAVKSNRKAYAASGNKRHAARTGKSNQFRSQSPLERGTMRYGQPVGDIGLAAPSRSYSGCRQKAAQFPGPRNGYSAKPNGDRGPYQDGSAYAATHAWKAKGEQAREGRSQSRRGESRGQQGQEGRSQYR